MQYCVKAIRTPKPIWDKRLPAMALTRDFKETIAVRIKSDPAFSQALLKEAKSLFEEGEAELARQILRDLADENVEE